MYKSVVLTFGLLMSSLVMLAIMPLLNYSSFSPTEAKAESEYGLMMDDNYKSKYPSFEKEVIECNNFNLNVNDNNDGGDVAANTGNNSNNNDDENNKNDDIVGQLLELKQGEEEETEINRHSSSISEYDSKDSQSTVICKSFNNNEVPSTDTATLTVKKQVFGYDNIVFLGTFPLEVMDCSGLQNNSSAPWLDCNTNANISNSIFCKSLPENIFDIEVLDDQNSQIQQFEGSEQRTTIPNLQPGTYTVNEIEQPEGIFDNQLADDVTTNVRCSNQEFPDGGLLVNTTAPLLYGIWFEYEDEQGNDCRTVTLAAGEERTCIVKNYIMGGGPPS